MAERNECPTEQPVTHLWSQTWLFICSFSPPSPNMFVNGFKSPPPSNRKEENNNIITAQTSDFQSRWTYIGVYTTTASFILFIICQTGPFFPGLWGSKTSQNVLTVFVKWFHPQRRAIGNIGNNSLFFPNKKRSKCYCEWLVEIVNSSYHTFLHLYIFFPPSFTSRSLFFQSFPLFMK